MLHPHLALDWMDSTPTLDNFHLSAIITEMDLEVFPRCQFFNLWSRLVFFVKCLAFDLRIYWRRLRSNLHLWNMCHRLLCLTTRLVEPSILTLALSSILAPPALCRLRPTFLWAALVTHPDRSQLRLYAPTFLRWRCPFLLWFRWCIFYHLVALEAFRSSSGVDLALWDAWRPSWHRSLYLLPAPSQGV